MTAIHYSSPLIGEYFPPTWMDDLFYFPSPFSRSAGNVTMSENLLLHIGRRKWFQNLFHVFTVFSFASFPAIHRSFRAQFMTHIVFFPQPWFFLWADLGQPPQEREQKESSQNPHFTCFCIKSFNQDWKWAIHVLFLKVLPSFNCVPMKILAL